MFDRLVLRFEAFFFAINQSSTYVCLFGSFSKAFLFRMSPFNFPWRHDALLDEGVGQNDGLSDHGRNTTSGS